MEPQSIDNFLLEVTQDNIDECRPTSPQFCAICKATYAKYNFSWVNVTPKYVIYDEMNYMCSDALYDWQVELYDKGKSGVTPITLIFDTIQKRVDIYDAAILRSRNV